MTAAERKFIIWSRSEGSRANEDNISTKDIIILVSQKGVYLFYNLSCDFAIRDVKWSDLSRALKIQLECIGLQLRDNFQRYKFHRTLHLLFHYTTSSPSFVTVSSGEEECAPPLFSFPTAICYYFGLAPFMWNSPKWLSLKFHWTVNTPQELCQNGWQLTRSYGIERFVEGESN